MTAYEVRISDWSSDVCSSDLQNPQQGLAGVPFFQVYEVTSNREPIRTLSQVKEAWASDYRYGVLAAVLLFLAAGALEFAARRAPPNSSFKPNPDRKSTRLNSSH